MEKRALACFSERYGAYPYQSYTLCEISFPMGGMEYPALAMIASDRLTRGVKRWKRWWRMRWLTSGGMPWWAAIRSTRPGRTRR